MGLLDQLLGQSDNHERSLTLKAKPLKDGKLSLGEPPMTDERRRDGKPADVMKNLYDESYMGHHFPVPVDRPFGFMPEGPTDFDVARQAYEQKRGTYAEPFMKLPEPLESILSGIGSGVQSGAGLLMELLGGSGGGRDWSKRNRKGTTPKGPFD